MLYFLTCGYLGLFLADINKLQNLVQKSLNEYTNKNCVTNFIAVFFLVKQAEYLR